MPGASLSNIFKHLSYIARIQFPRRSHRLLHRPLHYLSSFNSSHLTSSFPKLSLNHQWRPSSSSSSSAASSSPTTSKDSSVPPYLSVLIKCRKDVAVSFVPAFGNILSTGFSVEVEIMFAFIWVLIEEYKEKIFRTFLVLFSQKDSQFASLLGFMVKVCSIYEFFMQHVLWF